MSKTPTRIQKKKKRVFHTQPVMPLALFSCATLFVALINLLGDSSPLGIFKALLISAAAFVVTYSVNRIAIERGAALAAKGFRWAGAASVISILVVGISLFLSTFPGLVLTKVEEIRQGEHLPALTESIGKRNQVVVKAVRVRAVLQTIVADLNQYVSCEISRNCISGLGPRGRGRVTMTLEEKSGRASQIVEQLAEGETKRNKALISLNGLISDYQTIHGQTDKGVWKRRLGLQEIDSRLGQILSELGESVPIALLHAYAEELQLSVAIPDRGLATNRLNAILSGHGRALKSVLKTLDSEISAKPAFPPRTGVADTLAYIGHFAPIAAITFMVELVFPLYLWGVTFWVLYWIIYQEEQPEDDPDDDNGLFGKLGSLPRSEQAKSINPAHANGRAGPHHHNNNRHPRRQR